MVTDTNSSHVGGRHLLSHGVPPLPLRARLNLNLTTFRLHAADSGMTHTEAQTTTPTTETQWM